MSRYLRRFHRVAGRLHVGDSRPKSYPSHCDVGETTVFSCSIGRKVASLCASDDIGPSSGRLRYAFGAMGKPELVYPATHRPRKAFSYGLLAKGDYVRFENRWRVLGHLSHTRRISVMTKAVVSSRDRPGRPDDAAAARSGSAWARSSGKPVYNAKLPRTSQDLQSMTARW